MLRFAAQPALEGMFAGLVNHHPGQIAGRKGMAVGGKMHHLVDRGPSPVRRMVAAFNHNLNFTAHGFGVSF